MIGNIISLAKESEQKSKEVVIEKRRGDLLLYDVSNVEKSTCLLIWLTPLHIGNSNLSKKPLWWD